MILVFDERDKLKAEGKTGLHALIVGVSAYPHLPGGSGAPAPDSYNMSQLFSMALSAHKLYRWISDHKDGWPVPLATVRLLLSPSQEELTQLPELGNLGVSATRENFLAGARDWRNDAGTDQGNFTLFYFAGHGVQRSNNDSVLFLSDFGDGLGGALSNTVDTYSIFYGMAPPPRNDTMARTQFYFVDACRNFPHAFANFEDLVTTQVFTPYKGAEDSRTAPIYYAAIPGAEARAIPRVQSLFSLALLQALDGGAAISEQDENGDERWVITVSSLGKFYKNFRSRQSGGQSISLEGYQGDAIIRVLHDPPVVPVEIRVDPLEALNNTVVEVVSAPGGRQRSELLLPKPVDPHPYTGQLSAGYYNIRARIDPADGRFTAFEDTREVRPPYLKYRVRVVR